MEKIIKQSVLVTPGNFVQSKSGLMILRERFEVFIMSGNDFNVVPGEIKKQISAIVLADQPMTGEIINLFPNLKTIARTGTGIDNVDLGSAKERGIIVTRVSALNAPAVSEYALALLLALARNLVSSHELLVSQGKWERNQGYMLSDLTVGILGLGQVGRALARKLQALEAKKILGWDLPEVERALRASGEYKLEFPGLEKLIRESDAIMLAVALTPETRHLINRERLSWMKSNALLVNVARGALVDEEALAEAVEQKKIGGVALDVYSTEPPLDKSFFQKLIALQGQRNLILTPHMATTVRDLFEEISAKVAQNVIAVLDGNLESLEIVK